MSDDGQEQYLCQPLLLSSAIGVIPVIPVIGMDGGVSGSSRHPSDSFSLENCR